MQMAQSTTDEGTRRQPHAYDNAFILVCIHFASTLWKLLDCANFLSL